MNIGVFSFFSGAGFLDLGFEVNSNYKILFANENHIPFVDAYQSSRKSLGLELPQYGIHHVSIESFLSGKHQNILRNLLNKSKKNNDYICFIGGPPCPDFSVGGKNKGKEGENGRLSSVYVDLIIKNKPDIFLFENVKGLYRTKKHREFFDYLKNKLNKSGYLLTERLINSIEYGVPQDRDRIILVGIRKEEILDLGIEIKGSKLHSFNWELNKKFNASEVFSYKWPKKEVFEENSIKPKPKDIPEELTVEFWFNKNNVYDHFNNKHVFKPRSGLEKFKTIYEGDDLKKSYKRLHRWRYSPTAAYGNNEVHLHPYKARRLTVSEALAIQSLPKDFVMPENMSLSNMFKCIGNGVPFLAAKGLAETIISYMELLNDKKVYYA